MGRILFLDDMSERHTAFAKAMVGRGHDVTYVWNAADAIEELDKTKFDQAFLDHDLSIDDIMVEVGAPSSVPTGMTVVEHIMKMTSPPPDVVIHSCNAPAAMQMERKLNDRRNEISVKRVAFHSLLQLMYTWHI